MRFFVQFPFLRKALAYTAVYVPADIYSYRTSSSLALFHIWKRTNYKNKTAKINIKLASPKSVSLKYTEIKLTYCEKSDHSLKDFDMSMIKAKIVLIILLSFVTI